MPLSKKVQEIVGVLSTTRQALIDSVSNLNEAQLDYRSEDGVWSIGDILHHLALTDEANLKLTSNMLKQAEAMKLPEDSTPDDSALGFMDVIAERTRGARLQAPDFVAPRSHLPAAESLTRLKASREKIMEIVERLAPYDLTQLKHPHPLAGELNTYEWLLIAGGHESRHKAQIERIKSQEGFPRD
jgi:hypothetical protein